MGSGGGVVTVSAYMGGTRGSAWARVLEGGYCYVCVC